MSMLLFTSFKIKLNYIFTTHQLIIKMIFTREIAGCFSLREDQRNEMRPSVCSFLGVHDYKFYIMSHEFQTSDKLEQSYSLEHRYNYSPQSLIPYFLLCSVLITAIQQCTSPQETYTLVSEQKVRQELEQSSVCCLCKQRSMPMWEYIQGLSFPE